MKCTDLFTREKREIRVLFFQSFLPEHTPPDYLKPFFFFFAAKKR